jgi:RNA polymerase sigma factor (TIGR02999 family)
MHSEAHEVTRLLGQWRSGDRTALNTLMPLVEAELRRVANAYMRKERAGHTLQPTALINEAWMRMAQQDSEYADRAHFIAIAASFMRRILVDHARKKHAGRRGAGAEPVDLEDAMMFAPERSKEMIALDDGLTELARMDERQARIVELHFFGGMTYDEVAEFLQIGRMTVARDLRMAQIWLRDYIGK